MGRLRWLLQALALALLVLPLGGRSRIAGYDPTIELPIAAMMGLTMEFELGAGTPQHTEAEVLDGLFPDAAWRQVHTFRVAHGRVYDHRPEQPGVRRMVDPYLGPNGEAPIFWIAVLHTWRPGSCMAHPGSEEALAAYRGPWEAPMEYVALVPDATGRTHTAMIRCRPEEAS